MGRAAGPSWRGSAPASWGRCGSRPGPRLCSFNTEIRRSCCHGCTRRCTRPRPWPLPQIDKPGQGSSQQAGAGQGGGRAGRGPLGSEIVWILARLPPAGKGPPPAPTPAPPPTGPLPVGSEITNRLDSVLAVVTRLHLQIGHRNLKIEGRLWYQNPKSLAGPRDP